MFLGLVIFTYSEKFDKNNCIYSIYCWHFDFFGKKIPLTGLIIANWLRKLSFSCVVGFSPTEEQQNVFKLACK